MPIHDVHAPSRSVARSKEAKTQELISPRNTETVDVEPERRGVPATDGGAQVLRIVAPGTAPQHALSTIARSPSPAISRRAFAIVIPAVRSPFPHAAAHVK